MNKDKVEEFRLLSQDIVQNCKQVPTSLFMDYPEFGGNKVVESVGTYLPFHTMSYFRRWYSFVNIARAISNLASMKLY